MKAGFINSILIFLAGIGFESCIEPYQPDISRYENVMVVDGEINNLPGPYEVRLTTSYAFDEDSGVNITGAQVKIIDNTGLEVLLEEIRDGIYQTVDSSFTGITGNSYKLYIELNNEIYESDFEILKNPVPIDRVYWEYEKRENEGVDGVQLYLDTHDPANSTHYYGWEYEETWEFEVPINPILKPWLKTCFLHSDNYDFKIGTSIRQTGDRIDRYKLLYINNKTNRLRWRYSILVKQYSLSELTYQFYDKLIELNESQGTLFDPVPYSLTGNVKCITNKDEPVIGNFQVSGVSEKRIFIDNEELPREFQPVTGFEFRCFSQSTVVPDSLVGIPEGTSYFDVHRLPWDLTRIREDIAVDSLYYLGYAVYEIFIEQMTILPDGDTLFFLRLQMAYPFCFDCSLTGDNKVPDFWDEE